MEQSICVKCNKQFFFCFLYWILNSLVKLIFRLIKEYFRIHIFFKNADYCLNNLENFKISARVGKISTNDNTLRT